MDPAYPAMLYLADRFELNVEQRFWLAFLYAASYCAPTAWYTFNEFPDYAFVDLGRMERWWNANREKLYFQTDRRWTRSRNQFVGQVASYRAVVGGSQEERFWSFRSGDPATTYNNAYEHMRHVAQFGQFSMFLYLEAVHALTGFPMEPPSLSLREAQSSCNGLCYALGLDDLLRGHDYGQATLPTAAYPALDEALSEVQALTGGDSLWPIETSLCAYKKVHRGKRYLGYYIDRQHDEIATLAAAVTTGVAWKVLWDFRAVHFQPLWLKERRREQPGDPWRAYRPDDPPHWYQRSQTYL